MLQVSEYRLHPVDSITIVLVGASPNRHLEKKHCLLILGFRASLPLEVRATLLAKNIFHPNKRIRMIMGESRTLLDHIPVIYSTTPFFIFQMSMGHGLKNSSLADILSKMADMPCMT